MRLLPDSLVPSSDRELVRPGRMSWARGGSTILGLKSQFQSKSDAMRDAYAKAYAIETAASTRSKPRNWSFQLQA
jgi:hypothetical protein